jgi:cytochrome c oxidase cbb3-type subunit 3
MTDKHDTSGVPTTGHLWDDDLADLVNPPPKWWMWGLAASAIWCVVYMFYYPMIPISTLGTFTKGLGGWTAIGEMEADKGAVDKIRSKYESRIGDMTPAAILAGKVLFGDNCAACHGQNGVGTQDKEGLFAPILNDDDWLFGGRIDDIHVSISEGRQAVMPAHKDMLTAPELDTLANAIARGQPLATPLFTEKGCVGCHGMDGKGMQAMGSANLADPIWRFEKSVEGIKRTIQYGVNAGDPKSRIAIMPSLKQAGKLSDAEIKKLAVYVYKLGGGQPVQAQH